MIILAYKHQGVVYLATDTRIVDDKRKVNHTDENSHKIRIEDNGILVGVVTKNQEVRKAIFDHPEIFTLTKGCALSKRHIVAKIVPALYDLLAERDLLNKTDSGRKKMPCELVLAFGSEMYLICENFWVVACQSWANVGRSFLYGVGFLSQIDRDKDLEEQLVAGLKASTYFTPCIGGPFLTVNTKDLTYRLKEGN